MAQPAGPLPVGEKPVTPLALEDTERMMEDPDRKYTEVERGVTFTAEEEKLLLRRLDWRLLPVMVSSGNFFRFSRSQGPC